MCDSSKNTRWATWIPGAVNHVLNGEVKRIDPGAHIGADHNSKKIFVTSTQRGHEVTKDVILRFRPGPPKFLRVFQLSLMSPWEAHGAIDRMIIRRIHHHHLRPDVHPDDNLQQLWIRATKEQLQEIEDLLVQLGEVGVAGASGGNDATLRVIPVGKDVDKAIERIQELWPRIRPNPIRILNPGQASMQTEPAPTDPPDPGSESAPGQFSVPPESIPDPSGTGGEPVGYDDVPVDRGFQEGYRPPVSSADDAALASEVNSEPSGDYGAKVDPEFAHLAEMRDSETAADEEATQFDGTDPVIVIPGPDKITIASDDTDALNQLESILKTVFAKGVDGNSHRDFSIRQLDNTSATDVASTIQEILEATEGIYRFGNVAVVPEQRLNALIIYGHRTDRRRLDPLLDILDSETFDAARAYQTKLVTFKYSDATRALQILSGVYEVQMTSGGTRGALGIPSGVPAEVATVLRQINAAASAPLLTMERQRETNSILIKAPQELLDEVVALAMELDEAVHTKRANGVKLIPLKKSSSARVMEILSRVIGD